MENGANPQRSGANLAFDGGGQVGYQWGVIPCRSIFSRFGFAFGMVMLGLGEMVQADEPLQVYQPKEKTDLQADTSGRQKSEGKIYRPGSALDAAMPSTMPVLPPTTSPGANGRQRKSGNRDWLMTNPQDSILTPEEALGLGKPKEEENGFFKAAPQGWLDRYVNAAPAGDQGDKRNDVKNRPDNSLSGNRKPWEKDDRSGQNTEEIPAAKSIYDRPPNSGSQNSWDRSYSKPGRDYQGGSWADSLSSRRDNARSYYEDRDQQRREDLNKTWENHAAAYGGNAGLNPFNKDNAPAPTSGLSPESLNQTGTTSIYDRNRSNGGNSYRPGLNGDGASGGFGRFDASPKISAPVSSRPAAQPSQLNFPARPGSLFTPR